MPEELRQITITVISPEQIDIKDAAKNAADLITTLSARAMINIEITKEMPASKEEDLGVED